MEEKLVTKDDLLNKLRAYSDTPDDDNIVYKQKIKNALLSNPTLLYLLHEKDLEVELFDENGNINWEFDAATGKYKPLGEWDRYFGGESNIRPYLFIPDTQTNVKHYICYQVGFDEVSRYDNIQKYGNITFIIFIHGDDRDEKCSGLARHDLIASIIRERFNWSSIFGMQARLISNKESTTDNNYLVRTLVFQLYDINSITNTPYDEPSRIVNSDYWR